MNGQRHAYCWSGLILGVALLLACGGDLASDDTPIAPELDVEPAAVATSATGPADPRVDLSRAAPAGAALTVAAIQYDAPDYAAVAGCYVCGVEEYVKDAARKGARLVVVPSYALAEAAEPAPRVGAVPTTSTLRAMSDVAVAAKVTLIFTLWTYEQQETHQTVIAVDETGKVIGRHYKFQLFSDEREHLVPGGSVATSCFATAAGRVCMIDGADVHCTVTDMALKPSCSAHAIAMTNALRAEKPEIVAFTNWWTAAGLNLTWQVLNVNRKLALDWGVWVISANTTAAPGMGGGIWRPDGRPLATISSNTPSVVVGQIPLASR